MAHGSPPHRRRRSRRRKLLTHGLPVLALAAVAFGVGVFLATAPGRDERATVKQYVTAWQRGDVRRMYSLLDDRSRDRTSERAFRHDLERTAATGTLKSLRFVSLGSRHGADYRVLVDVDTRVWGPLRETLWVPLRGSGSGARVDLAPQLLFPGVRPGERLHRRVVLPPRASLLADDGTPLAEGPNRTSPIADVAGEIVGTLGPPPADEAARYAALGYPRGTDVGLDGLEHIFQSRLAGKFGGALLAGHRTLANVPAVPSPPVMTTISPTLERAAIAALGGQYGGIVVMNPRTGALAALAGIAFSAAQPPGSTMKIVTATAALQAGLVGLSTTFPVQTSTTIDGFTMHNANNEACGGTLLNAFAVSCNSVFAPLGVRVGAAGLVATAKRYGFDQPPTIPGEVESTIPSAGAIGGPLSVGASAIGQGLVQATPLEMTDIAATIAMGGRRPVPTLLAHQRPRFVRVTTRAVAAEVQQMMEAVVEFGTGTAAQIPGVQVAGKTGTAELVDTATSKTSTASSPKNTDAWFVGYAPVGHPRVTSGALFPNQGAGGATAAPAVRAALVAALQH